MAAAALVSAVLLRATLDAPVPTTASTAVWAGVVDRYIEGQASPATVQRGVQVAGQLDPNWSQPWFFGVLMLPAHARAERQEMLSTAAALHPDVRWFTDQVQR